MTDFISRDGLLWSIYEQGEYEKGYADGKRDAVPVVRCGECKFSQPWYADKSRCFLWHESGIDVFNDGYCSYGKRKEDAT